MGNHHKQEQESSMEALLLSPSSKIPASVLKSHTRRSSLTLDPPNMMFSAGRSSNNYSVESRREAHRAIIDQAVQVMQDNNEKQGWEEPPKTPSARPRRTAAAVLRTPVVPVLRGSVRDIKTPRSFSVGNLRKQASEPTRQKSAPALERGAPPPPPPPPLEGDNESPAHRSRTPGGTGRSPSGLSTRRKMLKKKQQQEIEQGRRRSPSASRRALSRRKLLEETQVASQRNSSGRGLVDHEGDVEHPRDSIANLKPGPTPKSPRYARRRSPAPFDRTWDDSFDKLENFFSSRTTMRSQKSDPPGEEAFMTSGSSDSFETNSDSEESPNSSNDNASPKERGRKERSNSLGASSHHSSRRRGRRPRSRSNASNRSKPKGTTEGVVLPRSDSSNPAAGRSSSLKRRSGTKSSRGSISSTSLHRSSRSRGDGAVSSSKQLNEHWLVTPRRKSMGSGKPKVLVSSELGSSFDKLDDFMESTNESFRWHDLDPWRTS